jgi:phage baseplate assembly protein W
MAQGLSPKLPVATDSEDGYALNKTHAEMVTQNLKNLILTAPGERIMDPNFGVGIRNYLFEMNIAPTHAELLQRVRSQVNMYMSFLNIDDVLIVPEEDSLMDPDSIKLQIRYEIPSLQFVDIMEIVV